MEKDFFPPNYWLVLSAQALLLPAILAYRSAVYPTAITYLCLWLTSSYYHSTYSPTSFYIDQIAVWAAVARSFVDGYHTRPYGLICTIVVNGYNYYVFVYAKYCSSSDLRIATPAHAGIHLFTSIAVVIHMILSNHRITGIDHHTLQPQL